MHAQAFSTQVVRCLWVSQETIPGKMCAAGALHSISCANVPGILNAETIQQQRTALFET